LNTPTQDTLPSKDAKHGPKSRSTYRILGLYVISIAALCTASYLWVKLSSIEELLAKQTMQSNTQSLEAKVSSKDAQELARETAAKLALLDAKVMEVALQRTQLEDLMQSLSRTRDDNLVAELESMLRLGQQQAQLMGSAQPLISALKTAEQRLSKTSQPKLLAIDKALVKDLDRIKSTPVLDTPVLLLKLDQLVQKVEVLPLLNEPQISSTLAKDEQRPERVDELTTKSTQTANNSNSTNSTPSSRTEQQFPWAQSIKGINPQSWWETLSTHIWMQIKGLVRITRIDQPEASLLTPSQGYFLKENLKLRLLNAKLGLLAHQINSFKSDLNESQKDLDKYFSLQSRQGQEVATLLREIKELGAQPDIPQIQDSWAAINATRLGN
jgi:uroporphyrin-3 C-methyltransferase